MRPAMAPEPDPDHPPSSLDDTVDPKEMARIHEMAREIRRESGTPAIPRPPSNPSPPLLPPIDRPPTLRPPGPNRWQRTWPTLAPILFGLTATLLVMALLPLAIGWL